MSSANMTSLRRVALLTISLSSSSAISSSNLTQLVDVALQPSYTLNLCEGDCDNDDECEGDLICFYNDNQDTNVPWGCEGTPDYGWDYCYGGPPILETNDGYVLIMRHKSVYNGLFMNTVLTTGMENINNPDNNTYSIIGYVNPDDYLFDEGVYWLRLEYGYSDGSNVTIEWTQESWITESTIEGADLYGVPEETTDVNCALFEGLGLSSSSWTYLDGDGGGSCWYNAVASTAYWNGGVPAFDQEHAISSRLYVRTPGIRCIALILCNLFHFCHLLISSY